MLVSGGVLCPLLFFAFLILLFVHGLKLYFARPARKGGRKPLSEIVHRDNMVVLLGLEAKVS